MCSHWLTFHQPSLGWMRRGGAAGTSFQTPSSPAPAPDDWLTFPPLTPRLSRMGKHRAFLGDSLYHFVALIALPSVRTHPAQPPSWSVCRALGLGWVGIERHTGHIRHSGTLALPSPPTVPSPNPSPRPSQSPCGPPFLSLQPLAHSSLTAGS